MLGLGLGLGIGQSPAVTGGGGGAWTPSSAAIALGAWYDPSDLTTLFKDTAGTTPVTADGDIVLRMNDKSGNGFHATITYGPSFGPIYRTNSGKPYLEITASKWLETSAAVQLVNASTGEHSAGVAVMFTNNTGTQTVLWSAAPGTNVAKFAQNNAGVGQVSSFVTTPATIVDTGPAITAGASTTLVEVTSTTACEIFVNGTGDGSTAVSAALQTGTNYLGICGEPGNDSSMLGKLFGAVIYRGALGSSDRASLVTYLAAKM